MRTLPYCAAKPGTPEHAAWVALYIDSAEDEYRDADRARVGAPSLGMKVDPRSFRAGVGTVGGGGGWLPWLLDDGAANLLIIDDPSPRLDIGIVRDATFSASNAFRIYAEQVQKVFTDLAGAARSLTVTIHASPGLWEALTGEPLSGPPVPPPVASKRRQDAFKAERLRRSWRHQR